jgi:D-alanine transaminase
MNIAFINGDFLPIEKIRISPEDRGFLFGDGIYEVMKWYGSFFFDPAGHLARLKRSLGEVRINWTGADAFPEIASGLVRKNIDKEMYALVYLQVTRGEAPRNHAFPDPVVPPTVYGFARETGSSSPGSLTGVSVLLKKDIRWSRCDIKSISLLPNTLSFQEARERGMQECIFVREGMVTEGSRSNIFLLYDNALYTYPESEFILSGITRNEIIRLAKESGTVVKEEPFPEKELGGVTEAFITNTSAEVTPVTDFGCIKVGAGVPGPLTRYIHKKFFDNIDAMKR